MARRTEIPCPDGLNEQIRNELDMAYAEAEACYQQSATSFLHERAEKLSTEYVSALDQIAAKCDKAASGYLNLITCTAIKAVYKEKVDVRYHQVQIQGQTSRPAGFNFRGLSEGVVYTWMEDHEFHGAKSGWQTRTFERPKPYTLSYDENIGAIKEPFLQCFYQMEEKGQDASLGLTYLLWKRIHLRESEKIVLAVPRISDVLQITRLFEQHFFYSYKDSRGASRLPVLALYAVYQVLLDELYRYDGKMLKPLEAHSAADKQTGAIGDIEIVDEAGNPFEALEIKHGIPISVAIVDSVKQKIRGSRVDRYYILTTYPQTELSADVEREVESAKRLLGVQMIVSGVIPSIKYYLRLLSDPGSVIPHYVDMLKKDGAIKYEHRDVWNKISTGRL